MKARVTTYLNARTGSPEILGNNNPSNIYFSPGDIVDIEESVIGQEYKKNSIWCRLVDGTYIWSGGINNSAPLKIQSDKMSWGHNFYQIPSIWNNYKTLGEGVTIAIIDTGIDNGNIDLKPSIHVKSKSFTNGSLQDADGHGTQIAGIIAASGKKIYGVAPKAKLLILKTTETISVKEEDIHLFIDAIDYAVNIPEVDIISISYRFIMDIPSFPAISPKFELAIKNCIDNNKIVFAAIGEDGFQLDTPTYPACYKGCIAIGEFNQEGNFMEANNINDSLKFLAPGEQIKTTDIFNNISLVTGTSIATAFTAGCLALLLSFGKRNNISASKCIQSIIDSCDLISSNMAGDIFRRLNINKAFTKLTPI